MYNSPSRTIRFERHVCTVRLLCAKCDVLSRVESIHAKPIASWFFPFSSCFLFKWEKSVQRQTAKSFAVCVCVFVHFGNVRLHHQKVHSEMWIEIADRAQNEMTSNACSLALNDSFVGFSVYFSTFSIVLFGMKTTLVRIHRKFRNSNISLRKLQWSNTKAFCDDRWLPLLDRSDNFVLFFFFYIRSLVFRIKFSCCFRMLQYENRVKFPLKSILLFNFMTSRRCRSSDCLGYLAISFTLLMFR